MRCVLPSRLPFFALVNCLLRAYHVPLSETWHGAPAQNSHSVTHVEYASVEMIRETVAALESDLPPAAVKLGMMGTDAVVSVVGEFLDGYEGKVVCDPVMISTRWAPYAGTT